MATELLAESKMGDQYKCKPDQDENTRRAYCKAIPENAPNLIADCISGTVWDFCYACCDNEFGSIHETERKVCEKDICDQFVGENTDLGHPVEKTFTEYKLAF